MERFGFIACPALPRIGMHEIATLDTNRSQVTRARTVDALWAGIAHIVEAFTPTEYANYFAVAGRDPD
jgi:hypothetical protein